MNKADLLAILKNKYIIASLLFLVWMMFFDPKDLSVITGRISKLNDLQKSEKHLVKQISDTRNELSLLKTSAQTIEKYAREKYYMKKDNEDLFLATSP